MTFSRAFALRLAYFDLDAAATAPAAAPAVASAPAPVATPAAPAAPAAEPSPLDDLRQRLADFRAQATAAPAAPGTDPAHHAQTQPRDDVGRFTPGQPGDPNAPIDPNAAPETVPTDAEGAEAEGAPVDGVEGEDGETDPLLVVELPNRYPEQEPLRVVAADQETAERLRQVVNSYERGEALRERATQLEQQREQLDAARMQLEVDPVGIVLEHAPAEDQVALGRALLTNPAVFAALAPLITSVLAVSVDAENRVHFDIDERAFRTAQTEAENERLKRTSSAREQLESRREGQRAAVRVERALDVLTDALPATLTPQQRAIFREDASGDVVRFLRESRQSQLHPADVPQILARRLEVYGLSPAEAARALATSSTSPAGAAARPGSAPRDGSTPRAPGGPAAPTAPAVPAPTRSAPGTRPIAQIRQASARRAAVAAQAPSGLGAPTGAGTYAPPPDADIKGAITDFRRVLAARRGAPA